MATHFPPVAGGYAVESAKWTTVSIPEWKGPDDDQVLIDKACASFSAVAAFGGKATFEGLFYSGSSPGDDLSQLDASLAAQLAFWTGKNCERIERIMRLSALKRDKWDRRERPPGYLKTTILKAVARCSDCYSGGSQKASGRRDNVTFPALRRATIDSLGDGNMIYTNGSFWRWGAGEWSQTDDQVIRKEIHTVCSERTGDDYKKAMVDGVLDFTRTELFKSNHRFNGNLKVINLTNGELHYVDGQWLLRPHYREHYFTTQIPVDYDPLAVAPRFAQFLQEVFQCDADATDKAKIVLEMIGYSLLSTTQYECFVLLIGSGANGKSVLLNLVEALIGSSNVSAVQPSKFDNAFQRAHLSGKLANIITEIAQGAALPDAQIKAIVSGELTTAEHKNKDPFDFRPFATCWFGTNHMPHTTDFTDALFRRASILEFNYKFEGDSRDTRLVSKLLKELPGILNMALFAIGDALQRDEITTCKSGEAAKQRWRIEADQVAQFVEDMCNSSPGNALEASSLYSAYTGWVYRSGIARKLNVKNFGARLEMLGFPAVRCAGGVRQRTGLAFNDAGPGSIPLPSPVSAVT